MRLLLPAVCAAVFWTAATADGQETNRVVDLAGREAQIVASALIRQNGQLREEVARLRSEVEHLTLELAQAKAGLDAVGRSAGTNTTAASGGGWQVVDVNRGLGLVVFDAGRAGGQKKNDLVFVMRGRDAVARARVVDVREHITGAQIEEVLQSGGPERGDRVVMGDTPR
jgi:hypothetical protein